MNPCPTCLVEYCICEVNSNWEPRTPIPIGSLWHPSPPNNDWQPSRRYLESPSTPSLPDRNPHWSMYGRKKPLWLEPASSWEIDLCVETVLKIGNPLESQLKEAGWTMYRLIYSFVITQHSAEFLPIMLNLLQSNERLLCIGVQQGLGSLEEPGVKADWTHILKIRAPNFGADIEVNSMLSWMSFVAKLESATSSDGSTVIRVWWNKKAAARFLVARESGLRLTWTPVSGIPIWTR